MILPGAGRGLVPRLRGQPEADQSRLLRCLFDKKPPSCCYNIDSLLYCRDWLARDCHDDHAQAVEKEKNYRARDHRCCAPGASHIRCSEQAARLPKSSKAKILPEWATKSSEIEGRRN